MRMKKTNFGFLVAVFAIVIFAAGSANALTTCTFTNQGSTMKLNGNCSTDSSIVIPNGKTLDGRGFTITGVDPAGNHFHGAVVVNGGASASVKNLGVTVSGLIDACDAGADRLRGIMFEGASGSITSSAALTALSVMSVIGSSCARWARAFLASNSCVSSAFAIAA